MPKFDDGFDGADFAVLRMILLSKQSQSLALLCGLWVTFIYDL